MEVASKAIGSYAEQALDLIRLPKAQVYWPLPPQFEFFLVDLSPSYPQ